MAESRVLVDSLDASSSTLQNEEAVENEDFWWAFRSRFGEGQSLGQALDPNGL